MRLIKPTFEIIPQSEGLEGIYRQIELAGRTCYKSEDKITDTSAKEFVERMIKSGHCAMLEHGTVYLKILHIDKYSCSLTKYENNKYSKYKSLYADKDDVQGDITYYSDYYVTTNYRVLLENGWLNDLKYICEPTEFHEKRTTVKFICDRGVSHEFVRHRVFSFAQESTRYCNYSKDKFDGVTFIEPIWLDTIHEDTYTNIFLQSITHAESAYLDLLKQWDNKIEDKRYKSGYKNNPWTPQQARSVLPNSLKTELVMTGFNSDWDKQLLQIIHKGSTYNHTKGFIGLRDDDKAHPQARELAKPLHEEFVKLNKLQQYNE